MLCNPGSPDPTLRVPVGLTLLAGFARHSGAERRWLDLPGLVPLVMGIVSLCPMDRIIGVDTCNTRPDR